MAGITTHYSLPYPQDTDNIDIATDMQTLATSVDSAMYTHISDTTGIHGIADTSLLATKSYADNAASTAAAAIVNSAPSTLDTLNELATALGNDANFSTTITNSLATKLNHTNGIIAAPIETVMIIGTAPVASPSINYFDYKTSSINYYTANNANNFILDIRGNDTTTLNSMVSTGESIGITLLVTNSSTAYMPSAIKIDGVTTTVKWVGGYTPIGGNANSIDMYNFNIIKTASATYTLLGSQTKFA